MEFIYPASFSSLEILYPGEMLSGVGRSRLLLGRGGVWQVVFAAPILAFP